MEKIMYLAKKGALKEALKDSADNIPRNTKLDITAILGWVYSLVGIVAVGFIVYGAISYAMAQGDPNKIKQASQTIAFSFVGLAVVILAAAITYFVASAA